ncbi:amylo-alpha-1,6-glucosidase [Alicyclobacillus sp. SO9]|uniref:amylo-alpha-1,6-glucosidase n=1 Tax=Alicyclobacillus sp. SO9 TaxID=2665646 RepID=UPI0018E8E59D|nr:amylo-alpha-1,6-glucosidase [Alicyclobacillus sp. SO9]QQE79919.1 amylo-alpha-1,6-glucosidase [Alicyclobacillus sp. SO9]
MNYFVIKDQDMFLLTDQEGNILPGTEKGLYVQDTRFLDQYELKFNQGPLVGLHGSCEENYISRVYLTNAEEIRNGKVQLRPEQVEVKREQVVYKKVFYERITLTNFSRESLNVTLSLAVSSRFSDLFEVRGAVREKRGIELPAKVASKSVSFGYRGLDDIERWTHVQCDEATDTFKNGFEITELLIPNKPFVINITVVTDIANQRAEVKGFSEALYNLESDYKKWEEQSLQVTTDSEVFNKMIGRGLRDLRTLLTDLGDGPFPVAGIPWFAVPFGRDSLIAALQMLQFKPSVARGTLRTLARLQGQELNEWRVEQPGKIVHEVRRGEMANLDEIPFKKYYGSVDSTPLFLILAAKYYKLTGDRELINELMPHFKQALLWLDDFGDLDGDGFVEYHSNQDKGLSVQSWKDSYDSMIHTDGEIAQSPMAVSEVQGYVYAAKQLWGELLREFGQDARAEELTRAANSLKEQFNKEFWMEDRQYFAIALDGNKNQVQTITSDPGQCLWTGIVDHRYVSAVVNQLMKPGLFSGWGVRTMSAEELVYNPISYHNGSVWAHDNSLILLGLAVSGKAKAVNQLFAALLSASEEFEYQRLPELFCGHGSDVGTIVQYPVACMPQAWAAGTPLAMVEAIMGLKVDANARQLLLRPTWPQGITTIRCMNMQVGTDIVSFELNYETGLKVLKASGYEFVVENAAFAESTR